MQLDPLALLLAVWAGTASALWVLSYLLGLRAAYSLPVVPITPAAPPDHWPRLSLVIAACNEGQTLEKALETLMAQDYPALEILIVDDRSTDETGAIVDRLAARDPRIVPLHITHLPDGWLGKVHALHAATQRATGEWLLFTDADIHFAPGALRASVAYALGRSLDHLALFPEIHTHSFLEAVVMGAFGSAFLTQLRAGSIADPKSDAAIGVGAFNLVKKSAFDRTEGFPWLRMEVADDLGLGIMLKRSGARPALALGHQLLSLTWYASLGDLVRGMEKNAFAAACHFSWARLALMVLLLPLVAIGPFAAPLTRSPVAWSLAAAALAALFVSGIASARRLHRPALPALFTPLGQLIMIAIIARSAWYTFQHGGIVWRGTRYPMAALRAGQRVKL